MIDYNNIEEFYDPANYDIEENDGRANDPTVEFYHNLARQTGGPIMELACGTGRVTIPIARSGLAVVGVDLAERMVDHAKKKSVGLPAQWCTGDVRKVRLARTFRLIFMTGNAFQAMLTQADQEQLLCTVRLHLAPAGWFAFETRNPRPQDLVTISEEEFWKSYRSVAGHEVRISGVQRYDPTTQIMHWTTFRRWQDERGSQEKVTRIAVHFTEAAALDKLLVESGFTVLQRYGNWDLSEWSEESPSIITVCRLS